MKGRIMRFSVICLGLALMGCASESSMLIVSHSDHRITKGNIDWLMQHAEITLDGRKYQGDYILKPSPQNTVIINNNSDDKKKDGSRPTAAAPQSKNGSGKMLLLSNEGDSLHCEFSYEEYLGMRAIGFCTDAAQREYDLQIKTAF